MIARPWRSTFLDWACAQANLEESSMKLTTEVDVICPYCGERVPVEVDPSAGRSQRWVEDCWVCCRPMVLSIQVSSAGEVRADASRER